jgi:hypothetical protein
MAPQRKSKVPASDKCNNKLVKATCVTVTQVDLASDPNAAPDSLASLSQQELENRVRKSVETVTRFVGQAKNEVSNTLLPVLMELEHRYDKQIGSRTDLHGAIKPGWYAYLRSLGVNPGTYRVWKSRAHLSQLKTLILPPPKKRAKRVDSRKEPAINNGAQLFAEAGMRLASTLLDISRPEAERVKDAMHQAAEMQEAVPELDINVVSRPPAEPQWVPTSEEIEALIWTTKLLAVFVEDKSIEVSAIKERIHAMHMLMIMRDRILTSTEEDI